MPETDKSKGDLKGNLRKVSVEYPKRAKTKVTGLLIRRLAGDIEARVGLVSAVG